MRRRAVADLVLSPSPYHSPTPVPVDATESAPDLDPITATTPRLDLNTLRLQARRLANESPGASGRFGPPKIKSAAGVLADAFDHPRMPELAKRLEMPLSVGREAVMADGLRRVHFSDGVCLDVPRNLPAWRESAVGATVLVPTTCPD